MDATMQATDGFSFGYYFTALSKILGTPNTFFRELPEDTAFKKSLGFLAASGIFSTVALLMTQFAENPILAGGIYFINAVGMTFIAAGLGYMLITMFSGRKIPFRQVFGVYAFASGVTLLASWIPLFIWITEPWRWTLIGLGLAKHCGFGWRFSAFVILTSIVMMVLFFWSLLPVISSIM
jgi:hypothetical protein